MLDLIRYRQQQDLSVAPMGRYMTVLLDMDSSWLVLAQSHQTSSLARDSTALRRQFLGTGWKDIGYLSYFLEII